MRLLEYEAKQLLKAAGLPLAESSLIRAGEPIPELDMPVVLKSQVPVGGRGKAGGIVVIDDPLDMPDAVQRLFALPIKDYTPHAVLAEKKITILRERYLALLINRETASIQIVAHEEGGIEVESNIGFYRHDITPATIQPLADTIAELFGEEDVVQITALITKLYDCLIDNDATLVEINPLAYTENGAYLCADAKMELDDAAYFRHQWKFEDSSPEVNFVTLDPSGDVATIANGAGLAMATVDAVAARGMRPANFLDVGGGANTESILAAFRRIMEYSGVRAIVINIFAGITRCDEVARAIIAAKEQISDLPPLFIRLAGTNFNEAAELLKQENIPMLPTLDECLDAARQETIA